MNDTNDILNSLLILNGKNWNRWSKQMKSLLDFHEILEVVTNNIHKLAENATDTQSVANEEAKKKDCNAAYCILSAVDSENFDKISQDELAKETWNILVKYYEGGEKVKVVKLKNLQRQYELMRMRVDENIACYVSKVHNLVHLMKDCGETLTEKMIVENVMWILNPRKEEKETHIRKTKRKKGVEFYNCEKWGHLAKNDWYNKYKGATKSKEEGANLARQDSDDYEDMVVMAAFADDHIDSKIWFLDTSCSNQMIGLKVLLADFDSSMKSRVKLTNNISLQAKGIGNIVIHRSNGGKAMIKVIYVPGMK
ncbi:uncharacterized protein LOC127137085 [Lathyrus oleraceus]|uniref:uncharacterized protein LOC127137085 n=1 Tax=Pisum sativum TaxID=3888 RepID=UPI0021D2F5B2|nr:uncharacterized protein LOC127137085 [Pisum sativum]